jgi:hypothetical protein
MTAPQMPPDLLKYNFSHILMLKFYNTSTEKLVYNRSQLNFLEILLQNATPYVPRTVQSYFFRNLADPHPRMRRCGSARV